MKVNSVIIPTTLYGWLHSSTEKFSPSRRGTTGQSHSCKVVSSVSVWNSQEVTLTLGEEKISMRKTVKRLVITFQTEMLQVFQEEPKLTELKAISLTNPGVLSTWREGRLAIGSLLGEIKQQMPNCLYSCGHTYFQI